MPHKTRLPWERPSGVRANQSPFVERSPGSIGRYKRDDNDGWKDKPATMLDELSRMDGEYAVLERVHYCPTRRGTPRWSAWTKVNGQDAKATLYGEDVRFLEKACGVDTDGWYRPGKNVVHIETELYSEQRNGLRLQGAWTTDGEYIEKATWVKQQQAGGAA